ncbi:hypothetical protein [Porphyromonas pogonae]|uniref:hypothetical protein n=1 Tax=Porphyromonas pogonae TaxID=867595 RepID=UPI002E77F7BF|nr:hypothetical protein [Porphyromonas pogonae]
MGIDLSLILPNDCEDLYDNAHALEIFYKTISCIKKYFDGREGFVEGIEIYNSDSPNWGEYCNPNEDPGEYSFELPIINATCNLKQGYWDIWLMARYYSYFWPCSKDINGNISLWARDDAFDAARIFGFSEGWVCDEYHSWNSNLYEDRASSFKKWCAFGKNEKDAKVYEFDLNMFKGITDTELDFQTKYHDNFKECHALVATYERLYPEYRMLTIGRPIGDFALASKGKELYVINIKTGKSLTPFPIDCCHANFNGAGFTVSKGAERAFFNREGKQLTDFREGNFSWRWSRKHPYTQVIIDDSSERHFLNDGRDAAPEDE